PVEHVAAARRVDRGDLESRQVNDLGVLARPIPAAGRAAGRRYQLALLPPQTGDALLRRVGPRQSAREGVGDDEVIDQVQQVGEAWPFVPLEGGHDVDVGL